MDARRSARPALAALAALAVACGGGERGAPPAVGRSAAKACARPDTTSASRVDAADLTGSFDLSMHVTAGAQGGSVVEGHLELGPVGGPHPGVPRSLPWIVEGRTTLMLSAKDSAGGGPSSATLIATAAAAREVVGFWDPDGRSIALVRGGRGADGARSVERGVELTVLRTRPDGFDGTWRTAFWHPPTPAGYFCARRSETGDSRPPPGESDSS